MNRIDDFLRSSDRATGTRRRMSRVFAISLCAAVCVAGALVIFSIAADAARARRIAAKSPEAVDAERAAHVEALKVELEEIRQEGLRHDRYLDAVDEFRDWLQASELSKRGYLVTCELNIDDRGISIMVGTRWHLESRSTRLALARELLALWAEHLHVADQRRASITLVDYNLNVVGGSMTEDPAELWVED